MQRSLNHVPVRRSDIALACVPTAELLPVQYAWAPFNTCREVVYFPQGSTLADMAPKTGLPVVCILDGQPVLRSDWGYAPQPGDLVAFQVLVQGGGGGSNPLRIILTIGVLIAASVLAPGLAGPLVGLLGEGGAILFTQALLTFAGSLIVNALVPVAKPSFTATAQTTNQSSVYSVNLSGNQAKLGDVIPVIYGRHLTFPDFASQPYSIYDNSGEDPDGKPANDQFYYALLCIGQGYYDVSQITLDDTLLEHFEGVETNVVNPGDPLTIIDPAVVGAVEVSGQSLLTGVYVGPFTATAAAYTATEIQIDIVFPRGLCYAEDDGTLSEKTCTWLVEAREVDIEGNPASAWTLLGLEEYTDDRSVQIRQTYFYSVPSGRYEVRIQRQDTRDDNTRAAHDISWGGMRAVLDIDSPLHAGATYLEIRMKANEQLNGLSQRRIACVVQRRLHTWNSVDGWSATRVATSSIAWAIADILRDTNYGGKIPESRIDLLTLEALDETWTERGDEFNYIFDQRLTVWEAIATAARCGRTARFMRGGVFTFARDEEQELPVALFNSRNITKGSLNIEYSIPTEETPDGLEVNFFDRETWTNKTIIIPAPGVDEEDVENPQSFAIPGITKESQIRRECYYTLAADRYRRKIISFNTELDGMIPSFGALIAISHDVANWGQANGEVVAVSGDYVELSEPVSFGGGNHYIAFAEQDGTFNGPYLCYPFENNPYIVQLDSSADFDFSTALNSESTRFTFGDSTNYTLPARVLSIRPQGLYEIEIVAVVEDQRVHDADSVVPTDPGTGTGTYRLGVYAPDGIPDYDAATEEQQDYYAFYADESALVGTANDQAFGYQPD